jgi:hypothetical protein
MNQICATVKARKITHMQANRRHTKSNLTVCKSVKIFRASFPQCFPIHGNVIRRNYGREKVWEITAFLVTTRILKGWAHKVSLDLFGPGGGGM